MQSFKVWPTLRLYLQALRDHKWKFTGAFLGVGLGVIAGLLNPILLKWVVDEVSRGPAQANMPAVWWFFWGLILINTLNLAGWRIGNYLMVYIQPAVMKTLMEKCFSGLQGHALDFFNQQFVGSLVKKVGRFVKSFESILDEFLYGLFPIALRMIVAVVVLFWVHWEIALWMALWSIFFLVSNYYLALYKMHKFDAVEAAADSRVTGALADALSNILSIKLFATEKKEQQRLARATEDQMQKSRSSWLFSNHIDFFQNVQMILLEAFMLYLALDLWQQGKVTPGDFILIQGYLLEVLVFAWDFGRTVRTTYRAFAEAQEMTDLLNQPLAVEDKPKAPKLKVGKGAIEFKKVNFAYGKQGQVLRDLNVSIQPGEKVALIGPSGGGKTTLIKLLLRLFDVQSGEILIDGQNIAEVTQASLRRSIALVPQDTSLFHRSLMENIRYGRLGATDAEVLAAAKKANCHDFIMKFPQGYQTHVGERGVKLSGGERQRIAIARAILSRAPILILDEATSSLDVESERLVQAALKTLLKGKTALVIAHRLSTIINMDRIVVLEKGRIVEEGSHDALLKKEDGRYRKFWDLQVGAYLA